ncbi:MAG: 50S ribosomal protein L25 [Actinobacteria bacterium]|nr:50S ribosomal protein L25 [Actinomycetota bacterium]
MADDVVVIAEPRSERGSGPAGRLRREGRTPAVVYGLGGETTAVTVPTHDLDLILAKGVNSLITLRLDGADQLALARQVQRHPVRGDLVHIDFVRVDVNVAIAADVALVLSGEAEGVKSGGLLDQQVFTLPIEAKPEAIPASIEFDVSNMVLGDQLRVGELTFPAGVTTTLDDDTLLAVIAVPRGLGSQEEEEGEEGAEGDEGTPAAESAGADED